MRFIETKITDAHLIDASPHQDERGRFFRAWCAREFAEHGLEFSPVQANMGFSIKRGTIRGMHFQEAPAIEAKLVRCTRGAIFDVVVDLRPESPSFGDWYGAELSAENGRMLYIPGNCAHGYQTLEDYTEMYYMTSAFIRRAPPGACDLTIPRLAYNGRWSLLWFPSRIGTGRSSSGRR